MTDSRFHIRAARSEDEPSINSLALRSKAHWGYDQDFMNACRAELTYSVEQIESPDVDFHVCDQNDFVIAFYALTYESMLNAELEAMFVEPKYIGCGLGKRLFIHAVAQCESRAAAKMFIQADRFAAGFYETMGAKRSGSRASASVAGRQLPMFEYTIAKCSRTEEVHECQK